jgi:sugar lactone lactonase YvrE
VDPNPILDFGIDKASVQYTGSDLQRPECILAERDGTLWAADARGGVVRLSPNGGQQVITGKRSARFAGAGSEAARYLEGTLPNGLAFAANGDILIPESAPWRKGFTHRLSLFRGHDKDRDDEADALVSLCDGILGGASAGPMAALPGRKPYQGFFG